MNFASTTCLLFFNAINGRLTQRASKSHLYSFEPDDERMRAGIVNQKPLVHARQQKSDSLFPLSSRRSITKQFFGSGQEIHSPIIFTL